MNRCWAGLLTALLVIGVVALGESSAWADVPDGTRDVTFAPAEIGSGIVRATVVDFHGRVVVGGSFTTAEGAPRGRIARYLADGSLDSTFTTGAGSNDAVTSIAIDADGNLIVGGDFTTYDGTPAPFLARLTSGGSLDASLNSGAGFNNSVRTVAIDGDGKIVVGGSFSTYQGTPAHGLARLTHSGSLDTSLDTGAGFWEGVSAGRI